MTKILKKCQSLSEQAGAVFPGYLFSLLDVSRLELVPAQRECWTQMNEQYIFNISFKLTKVNIKEMRH